jgi:hypothetical protein
VTVDELEVICDKTGIDIDDWPDAIFPQVPFTTIPDPNARKRSPAWRNRVVVWLALHQAGHEVTWDEAGKVRTLLIEIRAVSDPKDDGPDPEPSASPNSGTTTTRSSATSTE